MVELEPAWGYRGTAVAKERETMRMILIGLFLAGSSDPEPANWSRFRGPNGSGIAADDGRVDYPDRLDLDRGLRWRVETLSGHSSPCVVGSRLFLTGAEDEQLWTLCYDRETGEELWRASVPERAKERMHPLNHPATPTPTADNDCVVAAFGGFGLVCYDLEGEPRWQRELDAPQNTFGSAASPVLVDGRVIHCRDANAGSWLEVIDAMTGETIWRKEREGFRSGWSTPVVRENGEGREILVYGIWWLRAYAWSDGSECWSFPGLSDEPITSPLCVDGRVFATSYNMRINPEVMGLPTFAEIVAECDQDGDGRIDAEEAERNESILSRHDADGEGDHPLRIFFRFLDVDQDGAIAESEWQKIVDWLGSFEHANAVLALEPEHSEGVGVAWQFHRGIPECPSPIAYRGKIHLVKNGGLYTALDVQGGQLVFEGRLDARGPMYASPVAADGKLYVTSARGRITVVDAEFGPSEIEQASEFAESRGPVISFTELGERLQATPALVGGVVYVRGERSLFAFGSATDQ